MTRQLPKMSLTALHSKMLASALGVCAGLLVTGPISAQQQPLGSANGVVIDLSVLGNGGPSANGKASTITGDRFTLFPPPKKPVSRLEGPLANSAIAPASPTPRQSSTTNPISSTTPAAVNPGPKPETPKPATTTPTVPATTAVVPPPLPAAPPITPKVKTHPPKTQTTASPPARIEADRKTRILFDAGSENLTDVAKATLDALAKRMMVDTHIRLQLQAYAAGTAESAPDARRLSLSRALKARSHLINQGIISTRMDVRALGMKTEGGPSDRVDVVVVRR